MTYLKHFKHVLFWLVIFLPAASFSQLVGTSGYLIGENLEIGINDGGHEGAPRYIPSHNRSNQVLGSPVYFGFVANPQLDGWVNFDGDFFTPGTPENGFGIQVGGVNYSNNASGPIEQIPGAISAYKTVGDCIFIEWDGTVANVNVHVVYRLITTELYYTTEVTLTNVGPTDLTNVYYYRNVDPDNNITLGAGYATRNTVVAQPTPSCEKALVTATQTWPWDSYIGFGAIGENFRVSIGGFANRNAANIWNGAGGLTGTVGASVLGDQAIAISYKVASLPAGTAEKFLFTVVLDATQIDAAIASLYYFDYAGGGGIIDECAPIVDTAKACVGSSVIISVDGPSAADYVWKWDPPIGLSMSDGPTTEASPVATTEYFVTGTPSPLCLSATIEKKIVVEIVPLPIIEIIDPGVDCGDFDLKTLVVNNLEGSPDVELKFFSVIPDSVNQIVGLWPSDFMTVGDIVYVMMFKPKLGCYDVEQVIIDFSGGANAGMDNTATLCNDAGSLIDLNSLLIGGELGGDWAETSLIPSGGLDIASGVLNAEGVDAGTYTFRYIALALAPCVNDTSYMTITINQEALAGADGKISLCNIAGTKTNLNDLLVGNNGVGTWVETSASGQFIPATGILDVSDLPAGDYTFTYTVASLAPCTADIAEFIVTILPNPAVSAGTDVAVCMGGEVILKGSGAGVSGTYAWDGGVIDGAKFKPGATTIYTVTGTDANGCINTDDVLVTVNALPIVDAGTDFDICVGDAAVLVASGAGVGGTYTWDGGLMDGVSFSPIITAVYTVTGTDANGCEGTDHVSVTVNALPIVSAGEDVEICVGDVVALSGSGAGIGGSYVWDAGVTDGAGFNPAATSTYTVIGTDANGCKNSDEMKVVVNALPLIEAGEPVVACYGSAVILTGAGAGIGGTYVWDGDVVNGVSFKPLETKTYTVTGTDAKGCVNTDNVLVLINELPIVDAGADFEACFGDEVVLNASGAGVGGTYVWDGGVEDDAYFSPIITKTYTVVGTDENGCEGTDFVLVTVNLLPAVYAGDDIGVCVGNMATLTASGAGVGGTYVWDGGVVNGIGFYPLVTTTYTVTGTDAKGCVKTDDVKVVINALPAIEAGEPLTICFGNAVVLKGAGAGVGGSYVWDGGILNGISFKPEATGTYVLTGTDAKGCVNTDEVLVTVNNLPVINGGPDLSICIGEEVVLTATGAGVDGSYAWDGGVFNGIPFNPVATANYTVTGTDKNGCKSKDMVIVKVIPLPIINAGKDLSICFGDATTLAGAGAGPGGIYTWSGGVFDGAGFSPAVTATYILTGTTKDGCENLDTIKIVVNPLPEIAFHGDTLVGCEPLRVNFNSLNPGAAFEWDFGDGSFGKGSSPSHVYTKSGSFDITLKATSAFGCVATDIITSYVDIARTPKANFTYSPDEITISDTRVNFVNTSVDADYYIWNFGDGAAKETGTDAMHEYKPIGNTNYTVRLIAGSDNGCADVSNQLIQIKDVLIFHVPNAFTPDGDMFNETFMPVFVSGYDVYDYHLTIFNQWGERVFESYDASVGWNGTYGGGGLVKDGVYVWKIEFGESMSDKRHYEGGHVTLLK